MTDTKNLFIPTSKNTVNIPMDSESSRIKKFSYRINMLNDNFYKQAEVELGNVYSKAKELGLIDQIDDTNNLYRMVIEEISKVYDGGVIRTFDESETIQEDMTLLYEELDITAIMQQANTYVNAFNDVLLQVGTKEDTFNIKLRRPDNTVVVYNNDLELEQVYVYIGESDGHQMWYGYTNEEMFKVLVARADDVLNEDNTKLNQDGLDSIDNKLGFLPFISIHNGFRDDEFWQMYKGDDLVKGNIQVSIKLTFLNHLIKMQSFKQLVASGSNLRQLNGTVLDPKTILFLEGDDTKIDTIDLESNYKMLWDTIQSINSNIALNYKISPNTFRMTGSISSGFALKMENIKIDKFISKQQILFSKSESDLFNLFKRMDEKLQLGIIKSDSVSVMFPATSYPQSAEEIIEIQTKEISLGLDNQINIIMERDGVDKDTATQTYNENIRVRNLSNDKFNVKEPAVNLPNVNEGT